MAKVIVFAHQKGGVGKTTLCANVWGRLNDQNYNAVVMDTDAQGSLITMYDSFEGGGSAWDGFRFIDHSEFIESGYAYQDLRDYNADFVLIDTAPYLGVNIKEIFKAADLLIIPSKVSVYDVAAIKSTFEIYKSVLEEGYPIKAGVVLNMLKPSNFIVDVSGAIVERYGIKVFEASIKDRVSFARSVIEGPAVNEETDAKAYADIVRLTNEMVEFLNQ